MVGEVGKVALQEGIARRVESLGIGAGSPGGIERQKAAQEFVALLFLEVLKVMRASIPQSGLFETDSSARDTYTALADIEIARAMARREGVGLRRVLEKSLEKASPRGDVSGGFIWPTNGAISSGFGFRIDPLNGEDHFHKGVDIAAPGGSPVRAVASGKVVFSGWAEGYGNLVVLDHGDGMVTRYAHHEANLVSAGEEVAAGQEIALVGATGRSTGSHLHFEVLKEGQPVDPVSIVSAQQPAPRVGHRGQGGQTGGEGEKLS